MIHKKEMRIVASLFFRKFAQKYEWYNKIWYTDCKKI